MARQATKQIAAACAALMLTGGAALAGPCDIVAARTSPAVFAPIGGGFYDVFQTARTEAAFLVTVENTTAQTQRCRVVFESPDGIGTLTGLGDTMRFDVRRADGTGRLISDETDGTRRPRVNFNIAANAERTELFRFSIRPRQFVEPGLYNGQLTISTFLQGDAGTTLTQQPISFSTSVEAQGALFVSVDGRPRADAQFKTAFLDLGNITKTNNSANVRFLIQSNDGFGLQVSSENGGRLQLQGGGSAVNGFDDFISYTVNGEQVSTVPTEFFDRQIPTARNGIRRNFEILLDTTTNARPNIDVPEGVLAGRYQDTLTFTIVPE